MANVNSYPMPVLERRLISDGGTLAVALRKGCNNNRAIPAVNNNGGYRTRPVNNPAIIMEMNQPVLDSKSGKEIMDSS